MPKLFAYGTLMSGMSASLTHKGGVYLKPFTLKDFVMFDLGWFPGLRPGEGSVKGELWEVSENLLKKLDLYESAPDFYQRLDVEQDEERFQVYVLAHPPQGASWVRSGNWRRYCAGLAL